MLGVPFLLPFCVQDFPLSSKSTQHFVHFFIHVDHIKQPVTPLVSTNIIFEMDDNI